VHLLADAVRELIADNRREKVPTRAAVYHEQLRLKEIVFETMADYEAWRGRGRQLVRQAFRSDDFLLWITGNHLGALPVYDELARQVEGTLVIQLDAHLDIHNFRDCTAEPSHGNFLLHCDGPLPRLVNVGHRDLLLTAEYVGRYFQRAFSTVEAIAEFDKVVDCLRTEAAGAERVFLDVDCDVLDPTFFPAVTQAVPFGLSPQQLLRIVDAVWSPKVCGLCLSEFEPGRDRQDQCLALLVWLIEFIFLRRYE